MLPISISWTLYVAFHLPRALLFYTNAQLNTFLMILLKNKCFDGNRHPSNCFCFLQKSIFIFWKVRIGCTVNDISVWKFICKSKSTQENWINYLSDINRDYNVQIVFHTFSKIRPLLFYLSVNKLLSFQLQNFAWKTFKLAISNFLINVHI